MGCDGFLPLNANAYVTLRCWRCGQVFDHGDHSACASVSGMVPITVEMPREWMVR